MSTEDYFVVLGWYDTRHRERKGGGNSRGPSEFVLGLSLCSLRYDDVLKTSNPPEGLKYIALAHDLVILISARRENELERRATKAFILTDAWMEERYLKVVPEKIEAIYLKSVSEFGVS